LFLFPQEYKNMKRLLVVVMLMAFVTGASASEKQCKECDTTWDQWAGSMTLRVAAYMGVSSYFPKMQEFNTWALGKGLEGLSMASTVIMTKYNAYRGGAVAGTDAVKVD
jgi:hypothetical protein